MRATAPSDFIFSQKLLSFNIAPNKLPLRRTPPFFFRMAEASRNTNTPAAHPIQPKPTDKNPNPVEELPPPPEKPEPGDCCGSGCVRCVWDIYYDELEEYNKLHKQDQPSPKPSS